ncbi:O-antigen ligase family protein [Vibrio tasmaniensis]|uniref:O-antigen ligase family protein n=1 Tax=Vibrio tasmaniensis TaxID=212663 RepID=UPI001F0FCA3C|nr:O-antigen ligase family protein [Vibrio tasmaniensis]
MSSSFLKAESISRALLLIPYLWLAIGIIWMSQGNKPLVALVLIAAIAQLSVKGFSQVKENLKTNIWLWGVWLALMFTIVSYITYGASSQELRGLLLALVLLVVLPKSHIVNIRWAQYLLFSAALACWALSCWYSIIEPTPRGHWPVNPIPLAIHQGLVSVLSIGALLTTFKGKRSGLLAASAIISGLSVLLTQSRGGILALVCCYLLVAVSVLVQKKGSFKVIVISCLVLLGSGLLTKDALIKRYQETEAEFYQMNHGNRDTSIGLRLQMYQGGLEFFASHPILGHGEFTREYAEENLTGYTPIGYHYISQGHLHNNYIDKLARSGIIGLSIFLFLIFYPVYLGLKKYPSLFWLFSLPSIYYALASLTDSPFRNGDTLVVYMIITGTLIHYAKIKYKEKL